MPKDDDLQRPRVQITVPHDTIMQGQAFFALCATQASRVTYAIVHDWIHTPGDHLLLAALLRAVMGTCGGAGEELENKNPGTALSSMRHLAMT